MTSDHTVTAYSMSIASKSDHDPMVLGVKSRIRKKTAGKLSSCPENARAGFQNSSASLMDPDQTIGGIYRLFRECPGGADCGVSAGSKVPLGNQCLDNMKDLCACEGQWLRIIDFWAKHGEFE